MRSSSLLALVATVGAAVVSATSYIVRVMRSTDKI